MRPEVKLEDGTILIPLKQKYLVNRTGHSGAYKARTGNSHGKRKMTIWKALSESSKRGKK